MAKKDNGSSAVQIANIRSSMKTDIAYQGARKTVKKTRKKMKNVQKYSDIENTLHTKILEILISYSDTDNKSQKEELDFFLRRINTHQRNSLFNQHITMRKSISTIAEWFFGIYLFVIFGFTVVHIIGKFKGIDIFPMAVLVAMLGTVPINFIGLFAIILKDLFPRNESIPKKNKDSND